MNAQEDIAPASGSFPGGGEPALDATAVRLDTLYEIVALVEGHMQPHLPFHKRTVVVIVKLLRDEIERIEGRRHE